MRRAHVMALAAAALLPRQLFQLGEAIEPRASEPPAMPPLPEGRVRHEGRLPHQGKREIERRLKRMQKGKQP